MDIDVQRIESLLSEKKYDEVRSIITKSAEVPFSDTEKGAALTGLASTYLTISNEINIRYRDALEEAVVALKNINAAETRLGDKSRLSNLKKSLNIPEA